MKSLCCETVLGNRVLPYDARRLFERHVSRRVSDGPTCFFGGRQVGWVLYGVMLARATRGVSGGGGDRE